MKTLIIFSILICSFLSGCVTTGQVMSALPPGTVVLFNRPIDKAQDSWVANGWQFCSVSGLVRVGAGGNDANAYAGQKKEWSGIMTNDGYHAPTRYSWGPHPDTNGTLTPQTIGLDMKYAVEPFSLNAGDYYPPAQDYACVVKQ